MPEATVRDCGCSREALGGDVEAIDADGSLWSVQICHGAGGGVEHEVGVGGMKGDVRSRDGAMCGIVHDAVHSGKDSGECGD